MSRGDKWIPMDKYLAQEFKSIKREFSMIEAMFSYTLDADNGYNGSISGYSKLWGWSRNKVRRFIDCIRTDGGHLKDRKRTHEGHPIHFIDKDLWSKKDSSGTVRGQLGDTQGDSTNKPNPKPKELYSPNFISFWKSYPRKENKGGALKAYEKIKEPKPSLKIILDAIEGQKKTEQWQSKQFIPMPATWINGRRWEDELGQAGNENLTPEEILKEYGL